MRWQATHTADALRLLVVHQYGGIYLDLDIVVLRSLTQYTESVVSNI